MGQLAKVVRVTVAGAALAAVTASTSFAQSVNANVFWTGATVGSGSFCSQTVSPTFHAALLGTVANGTYVIAMTAVRNAPSSTINYNLSVVVSGGVITGVVDANGTSHANDGTAVMFGTINGATDLGSGSCFGGCASWTWTAGATSGGQTVTFTNPVVTRVDQTGTCPPSPLTVTNNATISIGTDIAGNATITATLHNPPRNKAHTVSVKYNGATVATGTAPAGQDSETTAQAVAAITGTAHNGDTWQVFVDGILQQSGTVSLTNIGTTEAPVWVYVAAVDYTAAADPVQPSSPTPTVAATATATPYTTPPAAPTAAGTPQTVTVNGQAAQNVNIANPRDIYAPILDGLKTLPTGRDIYDNVKSAIQDAGAGNGSGGSETHGDGTHDEGNYDRGHVDDLANSTQDAIDAKSSVVTSATGFLQSMITSISELSGQTFGAVTSITMDFSSLGLSPASGKITLPHTIDLIPWGNMINTLREILLWLLRLAFWVLTFKLCAAQGVRV